ncbi:hypothetical protein KKD72_02530 [Patescibacteria group bacterium]|nr:hypothetical protein [Patescibacteria group bacterium]
MEQAIVINRIEDLKHWSKKYTRIYFGNEFCPRLLPDRKEIDAVVKFIKEKKLKLTFLTSWVDSESLNSMKKTVKYIMGKEILDEVVVNDYGMINYLNRRYPLCKIVLGRAIALFVSSLSTDNFFYKMGIRRIEYNDLEIIRSLSRKIADSKISYYYPYSIVSASRYCPVADIFRNKSRNHGITRCLRECLTIGELKVRSSIFLKPSILKGNVQFVKNRVSLKALDKTYIDRLVFQP